ncbi:MAG: Motility protein [Planctomycetota bacterium]|jgi:flagellar motor protein MotB
MPAQSIRTEKTCFTALVAAALLVVNLAAFGCNNNPFAATQPGGTASATPLLGTMPTAGQVADMERRVQALDDNNRQLITQLAQAEQQQKLYRERADLLQKQLGDVTAQLQQTTLASKDASPTVRGIQASSQVKNSQVKGNVSFQANSSLQQAASRIRIEGAATEVDGDTIRIRIPADQIFTAGSTQLNPSASNILDPIAATLVTDFPKQRVGIEGHADDGPLYGGSFNSPLQLSTAQAMAVVDYLQKRNQLPKNQLFTIGHGTNHPRAENQTAIGRAENRRIEVVIYPTTF